MFLAAAVVRLSMLGVKATLEGACMPVEYVLLAPGKVHRELS